MNDDLTASDDLTARGAADDATAALAWSQETPGTAEPVAFDPLADGGSGEPPRRGAPPRWLWPALAVAAVFLAVVVLVTDRPAWFDRLLQPAAPPVVTQTAEVAPPATVTEQPSPTPEPEPVVSCGINLDADEVRAAMATFEKAEPSYAPGGVIQMGGNFDPCATLSTVLVYLYGTSGTSPREALMFHKGKYVDTATPVA